MPQINAVISAGTPVGVTWSWWAPSQRERKVEQEQVCQLNTVLENLEAKSV